MDDIYTTYSMMQALQSLRKAPRFLQDTFFQGVILSDDDEIVFDLQDDDLRLAPFVSPLVKGKAMKGRGFTTNKLKPAYLKPKQVLDPRAPIRRMMGEAIGGTMSAAEREQLQLAQVIMDQRDQCTRRVEWMCAQVIKAGAVIISGEDYETVVVDFDRDEDLTKALIGAAQWGQDGVSPFDDVEDWANLVGEKCGAAVDNIVFAKDAWKQFRADPKTEKSIDTTLGQTNTAALGLSISEPGTALYKGRIGNQNLWVYNDTYKDDDGNTKKLFDDTGVILCATGAALGTQGYGAILDAGLGYTPGMHVPKSWVENDPGLRNVMTQSAPLPFFGRINATFYAKTGAA